MFSLMTLPDEPIIVATLMQSCGSLQGTRIGAELRRLAEVIGSDACCLVDLSEVEDARPPDVWALLAWLRDESGLNSQVIVPPPGADFSDSPVPIFESTQAALNSLRAHHA